MGKHADRADLSVVWRWVFDAAVAGIAAYFAVILTNEWAVDAAPRQRVLALVLAFLHGAVVFARRRAPVAVLSVVIGTGLAYVTVGLPVFFLGPASLIAVYTVAVLRDRRASLLGLAAAEGALAAIEVTTRSALGRDAPAGGPPPRSSTWSPTATATWRPAVPTPTPTPGPFHPPNSNHGLGVELRRLDRRTPVWGHSGSLPGYLATMWYQPDRRRVIIVLANACRCSTDDLAHLLLVR